MKSRKSSGLSAEGLEFAPRLLAIQERPPAPLPRRLLYTVALLLALLTAWAYFGQLDIIASADGRLIPQSYIKIVQPADAGIVQEILVKEGQPVAAGQVLLKMDGRDVSADEASLHAALATKALLLRRVEAELKGTPMRKQAGDDDDLYDKVREQYESNRRFHADQLQQADEAVRRAQGELQAGQAALAKLREIVPMLKQEAQDYLELSKDGYVARTAQQEKLRDYLEKQHDLTTQLSTTQGLAAAGAQAVKQRDEVESKYRSELEAERVQAQAEYAKLQQDQVKQTHKRELLELRAPQAGTVKDVTTHTVGTVVAPGTVLLSVVPEREPLMAEVIVRNDDIGFVHERQRVKLKLAAYPFQKYGLLDGTVVRVSPDAVSDDETANRSREREADSRDGASKATSGYKVLVELDRQALDGHGEMLKLVPGMQVVAEIDQGRRTVLEYLLSPIAATLHDSARER